jgi:acyl carrier protein
MPIGTQPTVLHKEAISARNICALIADRLGVDAARVTDQAHLMKDFGLDWLQRVELVIFVEERAGIDLLDDDVDQFELVGDLVQHVIIAGEDRGNRPDRVLPH